MSLKELEASITSQLNERFNLELEVIKEVSIEEGIDLRTLFRSVLSYLSFGINNYWICAKDEVVDARPWEKNLELEACSVTNDFCSDEVRVTASIAGKHFEEFFTVTLSHDDKETMRSQLKVAVGRYKEINDRKSNLIKDRIKKLENELEELKREQANAR